MFNNAIFTVSGFELYSCWAPVNDVTICFSLSLAWEIEISLKMEVNVM